MSVQQSGQGSKPGAVNDIFGITCGRNDFPIRNAYVAADNPVAVNDVNIFNDCIRQI